MKAKTKTSRAYRSMKEVLADLSKPGARMWFHSSLGWGIPAKTTLNNRKVPMRFYNSLREHGLVGFTGRPPNDNQKPQCLRITKTGREQANNT
jgi:hypothetical protein